MQLNKYLALCGIASRRKCAELIQQGFVKVNGMVITNPAYHVKEGDTVYFNDQPVSPERKVYLLLNKPRGYVTTRADEHGRKTVMNLVSEVPVTIYPVGRLDLNTTGVLILTNDGALAQKLTHPSFAIKKTYKVTVDNLLDPEHIRTLRKGIMLEDGFIQPDHISYRNNTATIVIHSGKKRIVRRMFEYFGYKVKKLERINFAGLTIQGVPRGHWRYLRPEEIALLKNL